MLRYARYATAAFFALLAVSFVVLWVRSYYRQDVLQSPHSGDHHFAAVSNWSVTSWIVLYHYPNALPRTSWTIESTMPSPDSNIRNLFTPFASVLSQAGFVFSRGSLSTTLTLPHWFLAASSLGLAALFAFKRTWRYSLRTIIVATTLLAGLLGLAVWAM
jgi:hypothetical protein